MSLSVTGVGSGSVSSVPSSLPSSHVSSVRGSLRGSLSGGSSGGQNQNQSTSSSSASAAASTSVLDMGLQALVRSNEANHETRHDDIHYELHPRLAYSRSELTPSSFVCLNERTILFPVGLHLFKFDVGSQSIANAALIASAAAAAAASGETRLSAISAPLPGVAMPPPEPGANQAAIGCLEYFFKRSYSVQPLIAISRNRARLAICEDMERNPGTGPSASAAHHTRGHAAHQATAGGLSGAYKKAMISIIDLTADPPVLNWQFHHAHAGRLTSVDFSANGNLIAVSVELDQGEPHASPAARRRRGTSGRADGSSIDTNDESASGSSRIGIEGWHEEDIEQEEEELAASGAAPTRDGTSKAVSAVTVWRVDTHKYLASHLSDHLIHNVAINPDDSYLMVASGSKYMRFLKTVGTQLDEVPFLKRLLERTYHFIGHCWIDGSILAALTEESEVVIFQKGALKQVLAHVCSPSTDKLLSIVAYRDGFFLGSQEGTLVQIIPAKQAGGGPAVSQAAQIQQANEKAAAANETNKAIGPAAQPKLFKVNNEFQTHKGAIVSMIITPNDGTLVASVRDHGLCTFPMDINGKFSEFEQEPELSDIYLPCGDIVAMDVCEQRSLVVTASSDHTISIWSHLKLSPRASPCAIRHTFNEVPLAVAFHPNGYQLLIGFGTHIGMFHILRNSIKLSYSFQLYTRTVTPLQLKYNHGGDRIAIATGVHIFIYSSVDFALLQHIPGNMGIINGLEWSSDDAVIASVNGEGSIYAWELRTLQRIYEHVEKGVEFHTMMMDWGKGWKAHTFQNLHHGAGGGGGVNHLPTRSMLRSAHDSMVADGVELVPSLTHSSPEERRTKNFDPNNDRAQILAAGATFTAYKLKSISPAGAQDVKARDHTSSNTHGDELALDRISITHLIHDKQRGLVIAGTSTGYILLFRWPFVSKRHDGTDLSGVGGSIGGSGAFADLHAQVLGKFLVHEGAIQHLSFMPISGVLLSYGIDGNLFILDLRVIDLKGLLTTPGGQTLARLTQQGGGGEQRKRLNGETTPSDSNTSIGAPGSASSSKYAPLTPGQLIAAQHKSYRMNKLPSIMVPRSISNKKHPWQEHLYFGDTDLVLVKNSEFESILQEIRENSQDVKRMERTAEYQMSAQKDFYLQNLKTLRLEMESLLQSRESELGTTKNLLKLSETEKSSAALQHKNDVLELNTNWRTTLEKKLHESYLTMEKKNKELFDQRTTFELERTNLLTHHSSEFETLKSNHMVEITNLKHRLSELELHLKESEASYEEALQQLEGEHDVQVVTLERSSAKMRLKTREGTAILQAEVSAAKRKLEERNEVCKQLEALSNEKEDQLQHLASVIRKLTSEMTGLKGQLREKEENITRRQHELAQARQDNGTLKNFLEILEHRIAELENREAPALETMIHLKNQVESMSEELFELNRQKLLAQNLAEQKQGESTRFSITANNLRHKLAKKEHAWESVQKELKYIVEHLGHGHQTMALSKSINSNTPQVNVHADLKNLYMSYFSNGSNATEQPDRSLIEKVENEATRQRNFLEKSLKRLRNANTSIAMRTKADGEKALAQNINSLYEVNRLREENQRLIQRCGLYRSMVVQAGLGRKLDMIDSGDEGQAMQLIDEEQREKERERSTTSGTSSSAGTGRKNLMLMEPKDDTPQKHSNGGETVVYSQPPPLFGLASQSHMVGSQSSATLPAVGVRSNGGLSQSASTPALGYGVSSSPDTSRPTTAASSSSGRGLPSSRMSDVGLPRGKDALSIEGGMSRATRERAEMSAGASRSPARGQTPTKGTTRLQSENSSLKMRANELEKRLEQVSQQASLQAVHISALQGAIKSHGGGVQPNDVPDEFSSTHPSLADDSDSVESSSHFYGGAGSRSKVAASSGDRPASRGKLTPIRRSGSPTALAASASTPTLGLAGKQQPTQMRGQNANARSSHATPPAATTPNTRPHLAPIDPFQSMQANIESTLSGNPRSSFDDSPSVGAGWSADDSARSSSSHRNGNGNGSLNKGIAETLASAKTAAAARKNSKGTQ